MSGLDDLCVRFIINLPPEELESVERICFQVEEAQWFYEDFIRPLDPSLPSLTLRAFSLRIFQHCPLFSEWSADSYTAAFAEFLAYKSRVPVRGAIMLNEDMDQVVLVKGWKKGANWSFPRGKINKDEDDLDCAVREVYEETGFDIRAAGLVKDAKDTKYIEITMREQHMRLYVFRGVSMDTHFEPRTRKEISKIEWYKLNDLPTLKKNKQQEGMGENLANANKFYMVAPFLVPLKKWILQQRKRESRISSQHYETIPTVAEELLTDYETDLTNGIDYRASVPSDLPEVSQPQASLRDPSVHLQQLWNIEESPRINQEPLPTMGQVDTAKSNALLALLRKGSKPDVPEVSKPNTPFEQMSFPPDVPRSPHHRHPRPPQFSTLPPPPQFPISPLGTIPDARVPVAWPQTQAQMSHSYPSILVPGMDLAAQKITHQQVAAPYQRTGDPEFSHSHSMPSHGPRVPPASALPPLSNHRQALLDVFKSTEPQRQASAALPQSPTHRPLHTAAPANNGQSSHTTVPAPASTDPSSLLPTLLANRAKAQNQEGKNPKQAAVNHRANLLGLFKQLPSPAAEMAPTSSTPKTPIAPVELAASFTPRGDQEQPPQKHFLKTSFQAKVSSSLKTASQANGGSREGKTSATISGPLNQPQFEGMAKGSRKPSLTNGPARSPAPSHKTLFDPHQQVQKKILIRPSGSEQSPARSSRTIKPSHAASPKRPTSRKDDGGKPFQPQILRRPAADQRESSPQATAQSASENVLDKLKTQPATPMGPALQPYPTQPSAAQRKPQTETHKQTLLSLFGKPISPQPAGTPRTPHSALPGRTSTSPPASGSTIVSPLTNQPVSARSRLGSLASIVSTGSQARPAAGEKRQTAAGDKAFLLGYLGRIASQEG
jgi:mRNA-decapping enzyme subunit 2